MIVRSDAGAPEDRAEAPSVAQILSAAVEAFAEVGYHGTSVREIAARAGISVAGLYHHFASKLEILYRLIDEVMDDLFAITAAELAKAPEDPVAQLRTIVATHVRLHAQRRRESFVANTELRSLPDELRLAIVAKRDRHQRLFDGIVLAGAQAGAFTVPHPVEASRAIVTMCTAVAGWYRTDGPLSPDEVADRYVKLALLTVGYRVS